MTKRPKKKPKPSSDPSVAAFRALQDSNKSFMPGPKNTPQKATQKPRAKQQLRRRP